MASFTYLPVDRSSEIFGVVVDGEIIGIVWTAAARWHASELSMADRRIDEASRDKAAQRLLSRTHDPKGKASHA